MTVTAFVRAAFAKPCIPTLSVTCRVCHHGAVLSADPWPDATPMPFFGPHMVCTGCGIVDADARPNWTERPLRPNLTEAQWSDHAGSASVSNHAALGRWRDGPALVD